LALSSDHGVAPIPEHAIHMKLPGGRMSTERFAALRERMEKALCEQYGTPDDAKAKYIKHLDSNMLYFNRSLPQLEHNRFAAAQRFVREMILEEPAIAAAYTRDELMSGGNQTELFQRTVLSFNPQRSGDVLYVLKPYHIAGETTASHGSPWEYDTHVPLLMLGAGIRAGVYDRPVSPPQIAPTFSRLLGIDAPSGTTVEPLYEVLYDEKK
jgi:hypothetical protein